MDFPLYVSTEDDEVSFGVLLKKQTKEFYKNGLKNLRVDFNTSNPFKRIEKVLTEKNADLVILDVWSDLYDDSPNDFVKVRKNLKKYSAIAKKFKTCICLIHHNNKGSKDNNPDKMNLNGSQAIEAKLRALLEIREINDNEKQLSIVKGNYNSSETKNRRVLLTQDENLNFHFVRTECKLADESKKRILKIGNEAILNRANELYQTGNYSQDALVVLLKQEFGTSAPSKGTLNKMLRKDGNSQSGELIAV